MSELIELYQRIVQRVNINLRELNFDVSPFAQHLIAVEQLKNFYAFYGITTDHPLDLTFEHSALAGSYFLGKCRVKNSILYKSDIRGDELKRRGDLFSFDKYSLSLANDELIDIEDSTLIKTLVHNYSHDPETPERFFIKDTLSMDYANIHGAPSTGCFLGPFATVDLTTMRDSVIGSFCYIQAGEVSHLKVKPGTIWIHSPGNFNFQYKYDQDILNKYINLSQDKIPLGILIDFIDERKDKFERVFEVTSIEALGLVPETSSLDRYAVVQPVSKIGENVLISQRSYIENSSLGDGANAQENCFIINSNLEGFNVSAHGSKMIDCDLKKTTFTGFNSFLHGKPGCRITVGNNAMVMPHTIIDAGEPIEIPDDHIVWGFIGCREDLVTNSISQQALSEIKGSASMGRMNFEGDGGMLVKAFRDRIQHILEANGAYYKDGENNGHAQRNQKLSLNTIQPFQFGDMEGMYPNIRIQL